MMFFAMSACDVLQCQLVMCCRAADEDHPLLHRACQRQQLGDCSLHPLPHVLCCGSVCICAVSRLAGWQLSSSICLTTACSALYSVCWCCCMLCDIKLHFHVLLVVALHLSNHIGPREPFPLHPCPPLSPCKHVSNSAQLSCNAFYYLVYFFIVLHCAALPSHTA